MRAGQLSQAAALEPTKTELARLYIADTLRLRASQAQLAQHRAADRCRSWSAATTTSAPCSRSTSRCSRPRMRCRRGIVRGVSGELARKSSPQTYGASGRANVPDPRKRAAPLAVSRVL